MLPGNAAQFSAIDLPSQRRNSPNSFARLNGIASDQHLRAHFRTYGVVSKVVTENRIRLHRDRQSHRCARIQKLSTAIRR